MILSVNDLFIIIIIIFIGEKAWPKKSNTKHKQR